MRERIEGFKKEFFRATFHPYSDPVPLPALSIRRAVLVTELNATQHKYRECSIWTTQVKPSGAEPRGRSYEMAFAFDSGLPAVALVYAYPSGLSDAATRNKWAQSLGAGALDGVDTRLAMARRRFMDWLKLGSARFQEIRNPNL